MVMLCKHCKPETYNLLRFWKCSIFFIFLGLSSMFKCVFPI